MNKRCHGGSELDALLESLAKTTDPGSDGHVRFVGMIVPSELGMVRVIVREFCLTFYEADIIELTPEPEDEKASVPRTYRIVVRRGAHLLGAEPWAEFQHAASGVARPFALATRSRTIVVPPEPEFRSLEADFFQRP